jgi:hypothetical protein
VGLQEAVLWRTQKPAGATPHATHVAFDFVKLLVSALSKEGLHYRAAAITNNLDFQLPGSFPGGSMDIRYTDRVAIIVRRGVKVSNVQQKNFVAHSSVPLVGTSVPVPDGFASVDAKLGTKRFRFVTSHLVGTPDPNAPSIRAAEANELINGPFKTTLPVIFTCDCNSKVGTATHSVLTGAGLKDIWATLHANLAGPTCATRSQRRGSFSGSITCSPAPSSSRSPRAWSDPTNGIAEEGSGPPTIWAWRLCSA